MTHPTIPFGGFYAAKLNTGNFKNKEQRLKDQGATTFCLEKEGVLLAAWTQFPGQSLWYNQEGQCVAYDADLTNDPELKQLVNADIHEPLDTGELLWRLYRKFNKGFLDRLRGAFGLAIWDNSEKSLLVATDPFGIRPVVYADTRRGLIAASRIRSIIDNEDVDTQIDPEAIYHYLFFQAICSPLTIHKGIRKLEPGKAFILNNGRVDHLTHYDIRYRPIPNNDESHWSRQIRSAVETAVGVFAPLSGPEETGCYLSGGTDSSSVAGFYTRLTGSPAKTFSIGFDEPEYNEMDYAHLASRHFGTQQHDYYVTPTDVLDLIHTLPTLYDEPFGNSSVVPAYYCAKLAKESGVDVLLGGDGGDEIFGGNERYVDNLVFALYHRFPAKLRQYVFEPFLHSLPDASLIHKAKRYVRRANIPNPDRFFSYNLMAEIGLETVFQPDFLDSLNTDCFLDLARHHYQAAAPADDTDRLLYIDMKFTITDNDLRKVTQMAEAAGIQVRYPLLDRDLVDFTTTIPPTLKVKWKKNRYIFKQAMKGFLPDEIIAKSKHGMGLAHRRLVSDRPEVRPAAE